MAEPKLPELYEALMTTRAMGDMGREADVERIRQLGYQVVAGNIISTANYVRHDSDKVAKLLIQLIVGPRGRPLPKGA